MSRGSLFLLLLLPLLPLNALAEEPRNPDGVNDNVEEEFDEDAEDEFDSVDSAEEDAEPEIDVDSELKEELSARLRAPITVRDGKVSLRYPFTEGWELDDWEAQGCDAAEIRDSQLMIGAGSRRPGVFRHKLALSGDFEIEFDMIVKHNTPSAVFAVVLSKKISVSWAQQLVKTKSLRPLSRRSPPADLLMFREERSIHVRIVCQDDQLDVFCNRRQTASRKMKPKELNKVQLAFLGRNLRFEVSNLTMTGFPAK